MSAAAPQWPSVGGRVLFSDNRDGAPVPGTVVHVWGGSCVNVALDSGAVRTSVEFVQPATPRGKLPLGYFCVPFVTVAPPAPAPEPAVEPAKFRFNLGSSPVIKVSGEFGQVVARAEHLNSEPSYLLQYRSNTGDAVEQWWRETALS